MSATPPSTSDIAKLSLVIPVYNGRDTLAAVVRKVHAACVGLPFEVVLVNDGSEDETEGICAELGKDYPETLSVVHLSRSFGHHNAVLAGLAYTTGEYVSVMDDHGQPPTEEILRMLEVLKTNNFDVVYGISHQKRTSWFYNARTRLNDRMATAMLQKPAHIPVSDAQVMNRFVVNEVIKYRGPFPYINSLIYRSTHNIGQLAITAVQGDGRSLRPTTKRQRIGDWLNMFLNYSIVPLRLSAYAGMAAALFSVFALGLIWIDKIYFTKDLTPGIRTTLAVISLFAGFTLMILGLIGEYLGRLYLDHTGMPQFITRYVRRTRGGKINSPKQ